MWFFITDFWFLEYLPCVGSKLEENCKTYQECQCELSKIAQILKRWILKKFAYIYNFNVCTPVFNNQEFDYHNKHRKSKDLHFKVESPQLKLSFTKIRQLSSFLDTLSPFWSQPVLKQTHLNLHVYLWHLLR